MDFKDYMDGLVRDGYIDGTGKPLKCLFCDSSNLKDTNYIKSNYGIEEYDVVCKDCGKVVGHWAYGNWSA